MDPSDAAELERYLQVGYKPTVEDWKFTKTNQLAVLLLRHTIKGWKYELHVHYAWNGNGVLTGANVRWEGKGANDSLQLDERSQTVQFCDAFLRENMAGSFSKSQGTNMYI